MGERPSLAQIWHGDMKYPFFIRFVVAVSIAYTGTLLVLLFASGGSLSTYAISNLGDPNVVPNWWWVETFLYVLISTLLIPYTRAMYRVIYSRAKPVKALWAFFMSSAIFGLAATGIFNETFVLVHIITSIFAFGGFSIALFLSLLLLLSNVKKRHESINRSRVLILFVILGCGLAIMINELITYGVTDPSKLFFLEWMGMFTINAWLILFPWVHDWRNLP